MDWEIPHENAEISDESLHLNDITASFHFIVSWLFQNNSYFRSAGETFFGKKLYSLLLNYLQTQTIQKKHYSFLKHQLSTLSFHSFFASLDINKLNLCSQETKKFQAESLALLADELSAYFIAACVRYKIFEDILQDDFHERYRVIGAGEDFKVFQNPEEESYFLELEGEIYPDCEHYWRREGEDNVLIHSMFTGNNHTFIYTYHSFELREFQGEYMETYTVHDLDYICIEGDKNTTVYCLDDGYELEDTILLQDIVAHGEDTLIIASHTIWENSWKTKRYYVDIFSKNQAGQVGEIEWKLIGIKQSPRWVTLVLEESEVQYWDFGYEILYFYAYYYFDQDDTFEKEKKVSFGKNAPTKSVPSIAYSRMKTELFATKNDTLALISFFPAGPERDTALYNIISFTWKVQVYSIFKIQKIEQNLWVVEVWYTDSEGKECYFNSDYSYTLLPKQQPEVHKNDMH